MSGRHLIAAGLFAIFHAAPVACAETTTFTYDARGRVVNTVRTGGPLNGATTTVTYDKADNRTNVTVSNSPAGSGNEQGSGVTVATTTWVVVPLNGFTLISIRR